MIMFIDQILAGVGFGVGFFAAHQLTERALPALITWLNEKSKPQA